MSLRKYAGIGSRETPYEVCVLMYRIGEWAAGDGFVLRSGAAKGADQAFERGCDSVDGDKEIFKADDCTDAAMEFSSFHHPNWSACSPYARKLHGRNAMILLGKDLNDPVELVVCWTRGGQPTGGTAQGIRIAEAVGIPVFNLGLQANERFLRTLIGDAEVL